MSVETIINSYKRLSIDMLWSVKIVVTPFIPKSLVIENPQMLRPFRGRSVLRFIFSVVDKNQKAPKTSQNHYSKRVV